jgi:hypothetical protein
VTLQEELSLSPSRDAQLYENSIDKETIENAVFFTSSEQFKEVMFLSDSRRFDIAKSKLEIALNYLRGYVEMFPGSQRLQQLFTQMINYLNNIPNMEVMMAEELRISQKFSKSITWQMEKRKF